MWKKEDGKNQGVPDISTGSASSTATPEVASNPGTSREPTPLPLSPRAAACISQGIRIKGEVTGGEDLFVDGQIDGKLNLANVSGRDKVQLWSTGQVTGEIQTDRLSIEDGAMIHGKVEAGKLPAKFMEAHAGSIPAGASPASKSSAMTAASGGSAD